MILGLLASSYGALAAAQPDIPVQREAASSTTQMHIAVILVQFADLLHTAELHEIESNLTRMNLYYQSVSYGKISLD